MGQTEHNILGKVLDINMIQRILPHRYPFLLVDKVIEIDGDTKIKGIKNVTFNEQFFQGHFPGTPIMPGVLVIEAMAQASIVLFYSKEESASKKMAYYIGSVKVRFLNPVTPGDQLKITIEPVKIITGAAIVNAVAQVGDKEVAKGEISFSAKEIE